MWRSLCMLPIVVLASLARSEEEIYYDGHHCGNVSNSGHHRHASNDGNNVGYIYRCVSCFFPQNCLENNTCLTGTGGITCEKCVRNTDNMTDYYRVGNTCVECFPVLWSVAGLCLYFVFCCLITLFNGFTVSLCTKLKITSNFLQLLSLTFLIKIKWTSVISETMAVFAFTNFNSDFLTLGCLFPSWPVMVDYYLKWTSSFVLPLLVLIIMYFTDRSMNMLISSGKEKYLRRRSILRRVTFFLIVVMYNPVLDSAVQVNSCSDSSILDVVIDRSKKVFLHDQTESCDSFQFQIFQFAGIIFLLLYSVCLPLMVIFFTLRQRKWSLLQTEKLTYGSLYESYKNRCCFWEAVPMLRKLLYVAASETYILSIWIQVLIHLILTGVYIAALLLLRPYRSCTLRRCNTNINQCLDIASNLVIGLLQAVALLTVRGISSAEELSYFFIVLLAGVLILIGVFLLLLPLESKVEEKEEAVPGESGSSHGLLRKHNKVAPEPADAQKNIDF